MKQLMHPAIEDVPVEAILHALSNPVRVALYAQVVGQACPQNCSALLGEVDRPVPKSTLSEHMRILREAGLIRSERHGVEVRNESRCAEVDAHYPGLIAAIVKAHQIQMETEKRKARKRVRGAKAAS
jgi:DNA-binding transcriptional ArsR family regulator